MLWLPVHILALNLVDYVAYCFLLLDVVYFKDVSLAEEEQFLASTLPETELGTGVMIFKSSEYFEFKLGVEASAVDH